MLVRYSPVRQDVVHAGSGRGGRRTKQIIMMVTTAVTARTVPGKDTVTDIA